jgi:hypothetical protein
MRALWRTRRRPLRWIRLGRCASANQRCCHAGGTLDPNASVLCASLPRSEVPVLRRGAARTFIVMSCSAGISHLTRQHVEPFVAVVLRGSAHRHQPCAWRLVEDALAGFPHVRARDHRSADRDLRARSLPRTRVQRVSLANTRRHASTWSRSAPGTHRPPRRPDPARAAPCTVRASQRH